MKNWIIINDLSECIIVLYNENDQVIADFNLHVTFYEKVDLPCNVMQVKEPAIQVGIDIQEKDEDRDVDFNGIAKSYTINTDYDHIKQLAFALIENIYSYPLSIYVETYEGEQEQIQEEWANYDIEFYLPVSLFFTSSMNVVDY